MLNNQTECIPVKIVGDAAIASKGIGEGRLIPLIIIDTSNRPDIEELIHVHKFSPIGEVQISWCKISKNKNLLNLVLSFSRPSQCIVIIEFEIVRQGNLVDQILMSQALYIQPGREGDRLKNTMDKQRVLLEIPSVGFEKEWEKLFLARVADDFKKKGYSLKDSNEMGKMLINELRTLGRVRM
jgi:hypothetical protein